MLKRSSSKKKIPSSTAGSAPESPRAAAMAKSGGGSSRAIRSHSIQRVPSSNLVNETIAAGDEQERLIKAAARSSKSPGRFFGRQQSKRRGSTGQGGDGNNTATTTPPSSSNNNDVPSKRGVRRHHSHSLDAMQAQAASAPSASNNDVEYREVMVNGKKKMVRVKKKSAAEAAGGEAGHRKLVKVKVKKHAKKQPQQPYPDSSAPAGPVPIQVSIAPNHQLRKPSNPVKATSSDNQSVGVWSRAARSLFSAGGDKRSRASSGPDEEPQNHHVDLAFEPDEPVDAKSAVSRGSRASKANKSRDSGGWKPPTQLNGEPGVDSRSKTGGNSVANKSASRSYQPPASNLQMSSSQPPQQQPPQAPTQQPAKTPVRSEFFEKYADAPPGPDYDYDAPPVLEINTNANMSRTKTKSVYQSESMIRRQFIQDQWLSMGSNYQVWESLPGKDTNSVVTGATEYTSDLSFMGGGGGGASEYADDDVSEITHEDLVPEMLLEVEEQKKNKELDQWEALCADRIQRYGAKSALTAEAFVNRGIAQSRAGRLEDAADSLLSAVCFLEEVHGSPDPADLQGKTTTPAHMHMAQAFYILGKVYMEQEQYPMAESALHKALNIRQFNLGKAHPDTVECWEQLGMCYVKRAAQAPPDDHETQQYMQRQAMEVLTQVLKLKRAIFGSIHNAVAQTGRVVAKLCAERAEAERAQRLYKQVLNVLSQLDREDTACINPDFPDPRDVAARDRRKRELQTIEEEMKSFGLKEEILEI